MTQTKANVGQDGVRAPLVKRWRAALDALHPLARHHAGPAPDHAYDVLLEHYPDAEMISFKPGERAGYWAVPPGWVVRSATLHGPDGDLIADYGRNPMELFTYSPPIDATFDLGQLQEHLFSNPDRPDAIPFHFRNQYRHWAPEWGFCLADQVRQSLKEGQYRVRIDTEFVASDLNMALHTHKGDSDDSLLLVGHFDHPAQSGDGLIGCLAAHEAIERLGGRKTRLTYRALSTIEIVGSVFYASHRAGPDGVREALFSAMSGVPAPMTYAQSSSGSSAVDRAMRHFHERGVIKDLVGFRESIGNDEIAFDHQGAKIPCGSLLRTPHHNYHTQFDTPDNINTQHFEDFVDLLLDVIDVLETNSTFTARFSALPMLSHPDLDLYLQPNMMSAMPTDADAASARIAAMLSDRQRDRAMATSRNFNKLMTRLPTCADGRTSLLDLAEMTGVDYAFVVAYAREWQAKGLIDLQWINPFKGRTGA